MQIGTGWLGWTEAATLATTISTIELAYEGLIEKLRAIHGGTPSPEPTPAEPPPNLAKATLGVFRQAASKTR